MSIDILRLVEKYRDRYDHSGIAERALRELAQELREAEQTDYLGMLYRTTFSVTGRGAFPVDMLRYVNAWPADESDARAIEDSIEHGDASDPFTIKLTKHHRDRTPDLAVARWENKFRWRVLPGADTKER